MAFCQNCGAKLDDGVTFCGECGTAVEVKQEQAKAETEEIKEIAKTDTTDKSSGVVSILAFIGLIILFALPCIGFIANIIFCFVPKNKNIRHFAAAYLILMIVTVVLVSIAFSLIFIYISQNFTLDSLIEMINDSGILESNELIDGIVEKIENGEIDLNQLADSEVVNNIIEKIENGEIDVSGLAENEAVKTIIDKIQSGEIDTSEISDKIQSGEIDTGEYTDIIDELEEAYQN